MPDKVTFKGPFYATWRLNEFINEIVDDSRVDYLIMDGTLNTAYIQFKNDYNQRIVYELIEDGDIWRTLLRSKGA